MTFRFERSSVVALMAKVLKPSFFDRDSFEVAEDLIGRSLCRQQNDRIERQVVTEVEVYDGFDDRASHSFEKKDDQGRSSLMFGPAGIWYVYLCYGIHWMLNVVTREPGYPAALLIRGTMEVSGPGRLTRALKIDGSLNGKTAEMANGLWIEDRSLKTDFRIERTARIGVDYAGPVWSKKKFRFVGTPLEAVR